MHLGISNSNRYSRFFFVFVFRVFINSYLDGEEIELKSEFRRRNFHVNQSGVMLEDNDITVSLSV